MTDSTFDPVRDVLGTVNGSKWRRVGVDRKAGILVPLWSLRTARNCGIGEILDLERLTDWCAATGQKIIQLLPCNDTAYDAPPYCAVSAFALNPVYLSLYDIPGIDPNELEKIRAEFEPMDRVVYWKLKGEKMRLAWMAYESAGGGLDRDENFQAFCLENAYWLDTYAVFMVMKDKHEQTSWKTWTDAPTDSPDFIAEIGVRHALETGFYKFLQWHLDRQWKRMRRYANERGVLLKGDIPYLLNNDAADVWATPKNFNLDLVAGCPPDFYVPDGQYWSFPTYRWDEMERDGFRWWKERLKHAQKYFDIFRIDHVLGFFRLWSIAADEKPVHGQFVPTLHVTKEMLRKADIAPWEQDDLVRRRILLPAFHARGSYVFKWEFVKDRAYETLSADLKQKLYRLESHFAENDEIQNPLWKEHGKKLLTLMSENTDMLICAEDLGTVPACVRPTLEELGITTLLVDRWTKFSPTKKEKERGFQEYWIEPWEYHPISVSSPSNHDMPTIRGWWRELGTAEEGRKERWDHYHRFGWRYEMPDRLDADGVRFILKRNLDGESIFVILSLQDILDTNPAWQSFDPGADRINLPGTYSDNNWSWRMKIPLETLCASEEFNRAFKEMVKTSGR